HLAWPELFVLAVTLIGSVIGNVLNNPSRSARPAIRLSAPTDDGMLLIRISDDGAGYPEHMLGRRGQDAQAAALVQGSTGLGLYFGQCIAAMHQRDGHQGYIELVHDGPRGGGGLR